MATSSPDTQPEQPYGEIFDRGYQHYTGPRMGRSYAVRRLTIHSIRRGLGIKKKWTAKIVPILLYGLAYTPALIIVALLAFIPVEDFNGLGVDSLYGVLETVILVYAAALAPEMLCDDRRQGTLQLYFARPLTRLDYLTAKVLAMGLLMATVIFGPPLLLFLGLAMTGDSPLSYFVDNFSELLQIASYGVMVSAFYAAIALTISLFTTRKGVAAAILIVGVILISSIVNAFYSAFDSDWRGWLVLLSPFDFIDSLRRWVFANESQNRMVETAGMPEAVLGLWLLAVVGIAIAFMQRRYLREE